MLENILSGISKQNVISLLELRWHENGPLQLEFSTLTFFISLSQGHR